MLENSGIPFVSLRFQAFATSGLFQEHGDLQQIATVLFFEEPQATQSFKIVPRPLITIDPTPSFSDEPVFFWGGERILCFFVVSESQHDKVVGFCGTDVKKGGRDSFAGMGFKQNRH